MKSKVPWLTNWTTNCQLFMLILDNSLDSSAHRIEFIVLYLSISKVTSTKQNKMPNRLTNALILLSTCGISRRFNLVIFYIHVFYQLNLQCTIQGRNTDRMKKWFVFSANHFFVFVSFVIFIDYSHMFDQYMLFFNH